MSQNIFLSVCPSVCLHLPPPPFLVFSLYSPGCPVTHSIDQAGLTSAGIKDVCHHHLGCNSSFNCMVHDVCTSVRHVLVQRSEDNLVESVLSFSDRIDENFFYITSALTLVPGFKPRATRLTRQAPSATGPFCWP